MISFNCIRYSQFYTQSSEKIKWRLDQVSGDVSSYLKVLRCSVHILLFPPVLLNYLNPVYLHLWRRHKVIILLKNRGLPSVNDKLYRNRRAFSILHSEGFLHHFAKGAIHMVPPGLFLTDLGCLWSDFFETFRKWTLTLMTKGHGIRFA